MNNKYLLEFFTKYKNFVLVKDSKDYYEITGILELNQSSSYTNINIYENIKIRILMYKNFPDTLPKVFKIENQDDKFHINPDNSLCLGTDLDIRKSLYPDYSLNVWIEKFLLPYFYSYFYNKKYKHVPFGERSHGIIGEYEALQDFFNLNDFKSVYYLVNNLLKRKYLRMLKYKNKIRFLPCPCGSEKKIEKCHKNEISLFKKIYIKNNFKILHEIKEDYEQNNKRKTKRF